ncbi:hypothetical protein D3C73_1189960 [compost metagenome]
MTALGTVMAEAAVGPLSQAERAAFPWERITISLRALTRVTHGVLKFAGITERPAGGRQHRAEHLGRAWPDYGSHDPRAVAAEGIGQLIDAQFNLHGHVQLIAHQEAYAARKRLGLQAYLTLQLLEHRLAQLQRFGSWARALGIRSHAEIVGGLVNGHAQARRRGRERGTEQQQAGGSGHDGGFLTVAFCRSLAAGSGSGMTVGRKTAAAL